ncbi:MAG: hypothetical protein AAF039_04750 [Bacteroidota bacterium]
MGKLFFSGLITAFCLFGTLVLFAQEKDNYCVFEVVGTPMLIDAKPKTLKKGMFVYPEHSLSLNEGDKVILTDDDGVLYEINKKVTMPYARIGRYTKKEKQSAFTLEYLKYVWQKLWEREEKQNIGVVFRAPNYTQPIAPLDSVQIFMQDITFEWEEQSSKEVRHLYLQEEGFEGFTKLSTNGNQILIPVDGKLLKSGSSYRWSITPEADPEMENLEFRSFDLLQKEMFEVRLKEYNAVRLEFMALGLNEAQIKRSFCEDLKLCFN